MKFKKSSKSIFSVFPPDFSCLKPQNSRQIRLKKHTHIQTYTLLLCSIDISCLVASGLDNTEQVNREEICETVDSQEYITYQQKDKKYGY